ncbi:uncharacterized protein LOC135689532 [Rhopilema esculentum]|uniref:uncharacterized protein LOC135689532 n=1 Tax=Rhopilema esculentum TaxID=499914 RepID=UPI0031DDDFAF
MAAMRSMNTVIKCNRIDALNLVKTVTTDAFIQQRNFSLAAILEKPRKRWQWRRDRKPANTQLAIDGDELLEKRRTCGGGSKVKAVSKNKGSYLLKSQGLALDVPITDVIHSDANKEHIEKKIMTKGSIVQIDATEFRKMLECKEENKVEDTTSVDDATKTDDDKRSQEIDESLKELVKAGYLYGKITTRPGQVGLCDGYILEGAELQSIMEKLSLSLPSQDS